MIAATFYKLLGSPFGYSAGYGPNFHAGQDYPWGRGTPIPLFGSGRVVQKGYTTAAGYYATVLISGKYFLFYHMLYSCKHAIGANLRLGDVIGYVGTSGDSTGFHLHLAASNNPTPGLGWRVDPVPLVSDALKGGGFAGGGTVTPLPDEPEPEPDIFEEEDEMAIKYFHTKNTNTNKLEYGIFGVTIKGGWRASTRELTGQAWGKLYGTPEGGSWGSVPFDQWQTMQAESKSLHEDWAEAVGGDTVTVSAPDLAAIEAKLDGVPAATREEFRTNPLS